MPTPIKTTAVMIAAVKKILQDVEPLINQSIPEATPPIRQQKKIASKQPSTIIAIMMAITMIVIMMVILSNFCLLLLMKESYKNHLKKQTD